MRKWQDPVSRLCLDRTPEKPSCQPSPPSPGRITPHAACLPRMIPHIEPPPVARHIHFSRPPSTPSRASSSLPPVSSPAADSLGGLEGSRGSSGAGSPGGSTGTVPNSGLHAHVRALQHQLAARSEECGQLRAQLDAARRAAAEVGTLSEQLRRARREADMWRARAESAERRVRALERFAAAARGGAEENAASPTSGEEAAAADGEHGGGGAAKPARESCGSATTHNPDGDTSGRLQDHLCAVDGDAVTESGESTGTVVVSRRRDVSGSTAASAWMGEEVLGVR